MIEYYFNSLDMLNMCPDTKVCKNLLKNLHQIKYVQYNVFFIHNVDKRD